MRDDGRIKHVGKGLDCDAQTYRVAYGVLEYELSGLGTAVESVPVDDFSIPDVGREVDNLSEGVVRVHGDLSACLEDETSDACVDVHLAL